MPTPTDMPVRIGGRGRAMLLGPALTQFPQLLAAGAELSFDPPHAESKSIEHRA